MFAIILVLDFFSSAFFSAIDNVSSSAVDDIADDKKRKRAGFFIDLPDEYMNTWRITVTAFDLLVGVFFVKWVCPAIWAIDQTTGIKWLLAVVIFAACFLAILWLGVFFPARLAARNPLNWLLRLLPFGGLMRGICIPVQAVCDGLCFILGLPLGININEPIEDVTEEEIISMVNEGHEHGVIHKSEADMIQNIFEFDDKNCEDIMTRRKNIVALDSALSLGEALDFMLESNNSRFPVYSGDIDHIVGMIHIKDAMINSRIDGRQELNIMDIRGLIRELRFVPETQGINTLFKNMQLEKQHMVIVVDEYGQTSGLVAMEDILEEIVGNIEDEHDSEKMMIVRRSDSSVLIDGMTDLDDVSEELGIDFETDDVDTINGFLITRIDKIPEDNTQFTVEYGGYQFKVLAVRNKTISTVLAIKQKEDSSAESNTLKEG
ncbi:MAG: hemolysin family protein [Eubacterium sp.]|nr:hemolysin family protein [Eubacterium sp.]